MNESHYHIEQLSVLSGHEHHWCYPLRDNVPYVRLCVLWPNETHFLESGCWLPQVTLLHYCKVPWWGRSTCKRDCESRLSFRLCFAREFDFLSVPFFRFSLCVSLRLDFHALADSSFSYLYRHVSVVLPTVHSRLGRNFQFYLEITCCALMISSIFFGVSALVGHPKLSYSKIDLSEVCADSNS